MSSSPQEIRRVFFASIVGTIIEWYDFLLYGIAAALIFNKLFFPAQDPRVRRAETAPAASSSPP